MKKGMVRIAVGVAVSEAGYLSLFISSSLLRRLTALNMSKTPFTQIYDAKTDPQPAEKPETTRENHANLEMKLPRRWGAEWHH